MMTKQEISTSLINARIQLNEALSRKEIINKEIIELNKIIDDVDTRRRACHISEWEIRNALKKEQDELERKLSELKDEQQSLENKTTELREEITKLQRDFDLAFEGTDLKQIQESLAAVRAIESECSGLLALIGETENAVTSAAADDLQALREQRKTVAASVALGELSVESLADLDERIKAAGRAATDETIQNSIRADTVEGLQKRLSQAEGRLLEAKTMHQAASRDYLQGESDKAAADYKDKALEFIQAYRRIVAFDNMLGKSRMSRMFSGEAHNYPKIKIPWLGNKGFSDKPRPWHDSFYDTDFDKQEISEALLSLETELKENGAMFLFERF